jgi:GTP cyclohydrolase II
VPNLLFVRIHSQCLTGDVFHSLRCDCGEQLDYALRAIEKEGEGMIIYSFQEGRNIGILNKIKAYALQDKGLDTVEANVALGFLPDERTYMIVEQILKYYKLKKIRLLTNNPDKVKAIEELGIHVQRDAIIMESNSMNEKYFKTKKRKWGIFLIIKKPYLIAEIGLNYDGDLNKALMMIGEAKKIGGSCC